MLILNCKTVLWHFACNYICLGFPKHTESPLKHDTTLTEYTETITSLQCNLLSEGRNKHDRKYVTDTV